MLELAAVKVESNQNQLSFAGKLNCSISPQYSLGSNELMSLGKRK